MKATGYYHMTFRLRGVDVDIKILHGCRSDAASTLCARSAITKRLKECSISFDHHHVRGFR